MEQKQANPRDTEKKRFAQNSYKSHIKKTDKQKNPPSINSEYNESGQDPGILQRALELDKAESHTFCHFHLCLNKRKTLPQSCGPDTGFCLN